MLTRLDEMCLGLDCEGDDLARTSLCSGNDSTIQSHAIQSWKLNRCTGVRWNSDAPFDCLSGPFPVAADHPVITLVIDLDPVELFNENRTKIEPFEPRIFHRWLNSAKAHVKPSIETTMEGMAKRTDREGHFLGFEVGSVLPERRRHQLMDHVLQTRIPFGEQDTQDHHAWIYYIRLPVTVCPLGKRSGSPVCAWQS